MSDGETGATGIGRLPPVFHGGSPYARHDDVRMEPTLALGR